MKGVTQFVRGTDLFGGRTELRGPASDLWQRFTLAQARIVEVDRLAVPRTRPTVSAIGLVDAPDPAHLIIGGEDGDVDGAVVELIFRNRDRRYVYALPATARPGRMKAAASVTPVPDRECCSTSIQSRGLLPPPPE